MTTTRRFLLAPSFARLILRERGGTRRIEGYFPERDGRISYVFLDDRKGALVLRYRHQNGFSEERTEVPQSHAEALLDVTAGEIDYVRTRLSVGSRDVFVDQFIRPKPLYMVTTEFESEAEARDLHPLPWFGPEVSFDHRYSYPALAVNGRPDTRETEPSDAALGNLLDSLENRFTDVRPSQRAPMNRPAPRQAGFAEPRPSSGGLRPDGSRPLHQANLDDVQAAMMREIERTLLNQRPS
jgi:CYTH domain-containing protein